MADKEDCAQTQELELVLAEYPDLTCEQTKHATAIFSSCIDLLQSMGLGKAVLNDSRTAKAVVAQIRALIELCLSK